MAKADADGDEIDRDDGGDDDAGKRVDHHASTVANLLVEAGSFPHRAAALQHLLYKPSGQALLARMHKAADQTEKESKHELVTALTKAASEQHPELSPAQAFAELYKTESVWRAIAVAKAMPFVANVTPLVVGGEAAQDVDDPTEAIAQLKQLGARKWPTATEAQQFANAFTDPVNRELAAKAHRRPTAPPGGAYPYPR